MMLVWSLGWQLFAKLLETLNDHAGDALQEIKTEARVGLAKFTQPRAVDENGASWLLSPSVEMPLVGLIEPRPAKNIAASDGLDSLATVVVAGLQSDFAVEDQIEAIGDIAGGEKGLARLKLDLH